MGLLDRKSKKVRVRVRNVQARTFRTGARIRPGVLRLHRRIGSYTTGWIATTSISIDHAETYVQGNVHTNGIENFWSLLKRGLKAPTSASSRSICSAIWMNKRSATTIARPRRSTICGDVARRNRKATDLPAADRQIRTGNRDSSFKRRQGRGQPRAQAFNRAGFRRKLDAWRKTAHPVPSRLSSVSRRWQRRCSRSRNESKAKAAEHQRKRRKRKASKKIA